MTLRWKEFERSARRLIRAEVNSSKALKKQFAEARKRRRSIRWGGWVIAALMLIAPISWAIGAARTHAGGGYAFSTLFLSVMTFLAASIWINSFGGSVSRHWQAVPISREDILRLIETIWRTRIVLIAFAVILLQVPLYFLNEHRSLFEAVLTGLLQSFVMVAGGVHLLAFLSHRVVSRIGFIAVVLFVGNFYFDSAREVFYQTAHDWIALLPTAWPYELIRNRQWIFVAPIAALLIPVTASYQRLRHYCLREHPIWTTDVENAPGVEAHEDRKDEGTPFKDLPAQPSRGAEAVTDAILAGEFHQQTQPPQGWVEALAFKTLRADQRLVAQFFWPHPPDWTATWNFAVKAFIGILVFWAVAHRIIAKYPAAPYMVFVVGFVMSLGIVPIFSGAPGFRAHYSAGQTSALFTVFPISYKSMMGTQLRVNAMRILVWAPPFALFGAGLTWISFGQPTLGLVAAIKTALALLVFQPVLIAGWIAAKARIFRNFYIFPIALMALFIVGISCVYFVDIAESSSPGKDAVLLLALGAIIFLCEGLHRRLYRKHAMDLVIMSDS